jgi:hypothetical protein
MSLLKVNKVLKLTFTMATQVDIDNESWHLNDVKVDAWTVQFEQPLMAICSY